jgi:ubiquinone/menaquinone biosynthesis C-methylase UbiE
MDFRSWREDMSQSAIERLAEAEFDQFASTYDQLLEDPLRIGFASDPLHFCRRKWLVLDRMLRSIGRQPEAMTWLDVGCGRGEFLELAGSHFADAAGCDPSGGMLSFGRSFVTHNQPHPTELPFPSRSFDLVTAVCVYHHVPVDARSALTSEIRRVLRPGGLFCIIEHNPYNPVTCAIVKRCPVDADAALLSLNTAKELTLASGLRPGASEYFLYLPETWFHKLSGVETVLRQVPLGGQYALLAHANESEWNSEHGGGADNDVGVIVHAEPAQALATANIPRPGCTLVLRRAARVGRTMHARQDYYRAVPHQERGANPLDNAGTARAAVESRSPQSLPLARRRRAY